MNYLFGLVGFVLCLIASISLLESKAEIKHSFDTSKYEQIEKKEKAYTIGMRCMVAGLACFLGAYAFGNNKSDSMNSTVNTPLEYKNSLKKEKKIHVFCKIGAFMTASGVARYLFFNTNTPGTELMIGGLFFSVIAFLIIGVFMPQPDLSDQTDED
jgi:uncharacterized membrane protein YedE/YeeE